MRIEHAAKHPLRTSAPAMKRTPCPPGMGSRIAFLLAATTALVVSLSTEVRAQGAAPWDLKVCVQADNPPMASHRDPGFEQAVAGILADALDAHLSFVFMPGSGNEYEVESYLDTGACDVFMGAPEGIGSMLNSVPYYRAPYVFVARRDAPFVPSAIDDARLSDLRIGLRPHGLGEGALTYAGNGAAVTYIRPDYTKTGARVFQPLIAAVRDGSIDAAFLYGPYASWYVNGSQDLTMEVAQPEITTAGLPMFQIATLGVRPGDEALRDLLNAALARRWDDVQAVFGQRGIPTLPITRPTVSPPSSTKQLRIGVVLPAPNPVPATTDVAAGAAGAAAAMAEAIAGDALHASGQELRIEAASSPDAASAARAARRLVAADHVDALVGGLGDGQAAALAGVAEEAGIPFLDVGEAASGPVHCFANTFHVAPSTAMALDALAQWTSANGRGRWFVVHLATQDGEAELQRARQASRRSGDGSVVGTAAAKPGETIYYDIIDAIRAADPDTVVLLLPPKEQGLLLSELPPEGLRATVTGPLPMFAQNRVFEQRLHEDDAAASAGPRVLAWDPSLDGAAASALESEFEGRTGQPMGSAAWATYAAIEIVTQAAAATQGADPAALVRYLAEPSSTFDVGKRVALSFRPWDHQLRQPLYVVTMNPDAAWGPTPSDQVALARVVATVPRATAAGDNAAATLDTLGDGPGTAGRCE